MEFSLALLSVGLAIFISIKRYERQLEKQKGPWITEMRRDV